LWSKASPAPSTWCWIPNDLGARLGFEFGYQNLGGMEPKYRNASAVSNRRLQDYYGWDNK
jgi:hypothetical protein